MSKRNWLFGLSILLLVLCICFIFSNSLQDSESSSDRSGSITSTILGFLQGGEKSPQSQSSSPSVSSSSSQSSSSDDVSSSTEDTIPPENSKLYQTIETLVRKSAHLLQFALLGFLLCFFASFLRVSWRTKLGYVLFTGLFLGSSDELIQRYVPGRSSEVRDVFIDFCGVLLGIAVFFLLRFLYRKLSEHKKRA